MTDHEMFDALNDMATEELDEAIFRFQARVLSKEWGQRGSSLAGLWVFHRVLGLRSEELTRVIERAEKGKVADLPADISDEVETRILATAQSMELKLRPDVMKLMGRG